MNGLLASLAICVVSLAGVSAQSGVCRVNAAVVVDKSGSIVVDPNPQAPENWEKIKDFVLGVVNGLNVGEFDSWIGVTSFGNKARVDIPMEFIRDPTATKEDLEREIRNLQYPRTPDGRYLGENTNTSGGLQVAYEQLFPPEVLFRPQTSNILLLLTDGKATTGGNWNISPSPEEIADEIKQDNIRIIGVGVTEQVSEEELKGLVSDRDTDYIKIDDFDQLSDFLADTINTVCTPPTTTPAPVVCVDCCELTCETIPGRPCYTECPALCRGSVICPDVLPIRLEDGHCGLPSECDETPCVEACRIDLQLVVDESGSIGRDKGINFWERDVRPFILSLIQRIQVGYYETHVSLITFADDAIVRFRMDTYNTTEEIQDAIPQGDECRCVFGGNTNTSGGLRLAHQMLGENMGDRPEVVNVVLLFTDGEDTRDQDLLEREARLVRDEARLVVVGVSEDVNKTRLLSILRSPDDYFEVTDFENLASILTSLISRTCNQCENGTCPAPTPEEQVVAYHAYRKGPMFAEDGTVIPFDQMYTNYGGGFDIATGIYTCPCTGMYFFMFTYSDVGCTFGAVIKKNGEVISALSHVEYHGSMTLNALHYCSVGEQVYVEVMGADDEETIYPSYLNQPTMSFSGYLVTAMR